MAECKEIVVADTEMAVQEMPDDDDEVEVTMIMGSDPFAVARGDVFARVWCSQELLELMISYVVQFLPDPDSFLMRRLLE